MSRDIKLLRSKSARERLTKRGLSEGRGLPLGRGRCGSFSSSASSSDLVGLCDGLCTSKHYLIPFLCKRKYNNDATLIIVMNLVSHDLDARMNLFVNWGSRGTESQKKITKLLQHWKQFVGSHLVCYVVSKIFSKTASTSWERNINQAHHELTKSGRGGLWCGSFCSSAVSAKATVAPRNRNSIREFILSTVFADSQSIVTGKAHCRSFISVRDWDGI